MKGAKIWKGGRKTDVDDSYKGVDVVVNLSEYI